MNLSPKFVSGFSDVPNTRAAGDGLIADSRSLLQVEDGSRVDSVHDPERQHQNNEHCIQNIINERKRKTHMFQMAKISMTTLKVILMMMMKVMI